MAKELFRFIQARAPGRSVPCPINRYLIRNLPKSHELLDRLLADRENPEAAAATARSFFDSPPWQNLDPTLRELHGVAEDLRDDRMPSRESLFRTLSIILEPEIVPVAVGHSLGIAKPEQPFTEGAPARDRREIFIQGPITQELVQYWWARFPNPETGLPFQNQHQLYTHLVSIRDRLKKLERDAEQQLPRGK